MIIFFIIKELAEEFRKISYFFSKKYHKNSKPLHFQWKNKLQELIIMEKKLQKIYLTYCNLLIVQGLWPVHYQIFLCLK